MSGSTAIEAYFVRVDDEGRLVIDVDGRQVAVPVTDALARGVEEARRRLDDAKDARTGRSIPISTIQMLVRQGMSIADVAKGHGISESQVSRFAQPILLERKMAIEQFLSLPVPRPATGAGTALPASAHSIGDLVRERFTVDGTARASVEWAASRKPRQPWLIVATIHAPHRTLGAQWQWNVAENTVTPLNPTATWILEGTEPARRAVEAGMAPGSDTEEGNGDADTPGHVRKGTAATAGQDTYAGESGGAHAPMPAPTAPPRPTASTRPVTDVPGDGVAAAPDAPPRAQAPAPAPTPETTPAQGPDSDKDDDGTTHRQAAPQQSGAPRRRPKRTAVPSWDEIMFGE